jgi:hypothetical protein
MWRRYCMLTEPDELTEWLIVKIHEKSDLDSPRSLEQPQYCIGFSVFNPILVPILAPRMAPIKTFYKHQKLKVHKNIFRICTGFIYLLLSSLSLSWKYLNLLLSLAYYITNKTFYERIYLCHIFCCNAI